MLRPVYLLLFRLFGWKIVGFIPKELKKYIIAVGPHTSNWDFIIGVAARSILQIKKAKFLGKSQLFQPPYGWIFKLLGGIPVERKESNDVTDQVAEIFNQHSEFILAVAPEGTRRKVERLKTGFYYIALKANVPVLPAGFDFTRREVRLGTPFYASGNIEKDMATMMQFYRSIGGKNPALGIS